MAELGATLAGLLPFLAYFILGLVIMAIFMWIYTQLTPYDEVALVKANNVAASLVWIGALLGFVLPLTSAMRESFSILEFVVWGLIAGIAQYCVFWGYRFFYPRIRERIELGEVAASLKLAGVSVAVGLMNAAAIVE